jgi:hypothetical protein
MPEPFSPELSDAILDMVSDGHSLRTTCEKLGLARRTVRSWLERNSEFAQQYESARKLHIDVHVDRMLDIAAGVSGSESNAQVQAAKLEIDTVKWIAGRLLPHRYGDRVALTGADGRDLIPEHAADTGKATTAFLMALKTLPTPPAALDYQPVSEGADDD